ncbi:MAG: hypothetical protein ACE5JM_13435 [Armatimonadota bacterium]
MAAVIQQEGVTLTSGAGDNTKLPIAEGLFLTAATCVVPTGSGPTHVAAFLRQGSKAIVLFHGWVRGVADVGRAHTLTWTGRLKIPANAEIQFSGRQDTGSEIRPVFTWVLSDD